MGQREAGCPRHTQTRPAQGPAGYRAKVMVKSEWWHKKTSFFFLIVIKMLIYVLWWDTCCGVTFTCSGVTFKCCCVTFTCCGVTFTCCGVTIRCCGVTIFFSLSLFPSHSLYVCLQIFYKPRYQLHCLWTGIPLTTTVSKNKTRKWGWGEGIHCSI